MPKPLIAVVVRRSSLACVAQMVVAFGLAAYAAFFVSFLVAVALVCSTLVLVVLQHRATPRRWHLRCRFENEHAIWEVAEDAGTWRGVTCRLVRLAPQLSAIEIDGRRIWLWPDSSDVQSMRRLREVLGEQAAIPSHTP